MIYQLIGSQKESQRVLQAAKLRVEEIKQMVEGDNDIQILGQVEEGMEN